MKKDEMVRTEVGDDVLRTPGDEENRPPKTTKEARRKDLQDQIKNRRRIQVGETEEETETVFEHQDKPTEPDNEPEETPGQEVREEEAQPASQPGGQTGQADQADQEERDDQSAQPAPDRQADASPPGRLPFWAELLQRTFEGDTGRLEALAEVPEHYLDVVDEDPIPVTWVMDGQEIPSSYDIVEYYPCTDERWWDRMVLRYRPERNAFAPEGGKKLQLRINDEQYDVVSEYISNQCAGGTPDVFGYETVFLIVKGGEEDGEQESSGQRGTGFIS